MRRAGISNFRAGVIGLVVLVTFVYFAWVGASPFEHQYELKAVLQGAPELHSRTPVRVAGVELGRVTKVEAGPGDASTVTIELQDAALPVHEDATLKVRTRLFLEGNFFVDLHPGTPSADKLDDGGTIPLSQTAVPVQLDEIIAEFRRPQREDLRGFIAELAKAFEGGGAEALGGTLDQLGPTFRALARVSEATRGDNDALADAILFSERTARAIDRHEARLPDLVTGFNRSARAVAARRVELEAALPQLDALLSEANPALAEVQRLTPPARAFVADIRPGLRAAPATLRLAGPFLDQVDRLIRQTPALVAQAGPSFTSLAQAAPGLQRVFDLVTPVTECLRRNAIPTLKTKISDPPHSTGDPVYLDLVHAAVGQASASQNFDGNGPAVRYHAGFGTQSVSLQGLNETIVGLTPEPIIGSRPRKPAQQPPFRPDVPCVTQDPPNLAAETGPAPLQTRVRTPRERVDLSPRELRANVRRAADAIAKALR